MAIELSEQKSREQAALIEQIKWPLIMMDKEYLKELAKAMKQDAHDYDSMAALNRNYDPNVSALKVRSAITIEKIAELIESLKECDKLKLSIKNFEASQDEIQKIFS